MSTYAVNVCRFSDDPRALIELYQALGLRLRVDAEDEGHALLKAGDGWVTVQALAGAGVPDGIAPGDARLAFLSRSVEAVVADLRARGLDVDSGDGRTGLEASVPGPFGAEVRITETEVELLGYEAHDDPVTTPLVVTAVLYSDDFGRDTEFFAHFGLEPVGEASPHWTALDGRRGRVGLHPPDVGRGEQGSRAGSVDLAFETTEPLEDVVHRLRLAGYDDARLVGDGRLRAVHVTDPDGRELQVHELTT